MAFCLAAAVLELIAQVTHGGIYPVETVIDGVGQSVGAVTDAVLNGVDAGLEVVQGKALVDIGAGRPALTGGRTQPIAGTIAPAVAPAAAKGSPDKE